MALTVLLPAFCPKKGGKIKFPAPKKSEKSMKLMSSIFFRSSFMGCILLRMTNWRKTKKKHTRMFQSITPCRLRVKIAMRKS